MKVSIKITDFVIEADGEEAVKAAQQAVNGLLDEMMRGNPPTPLVIVDRPEAGCCDGNEITVRDVASRKKPGRKKKGVK